MQIRLAEREKNWNHESNHNSISKHRCDEGHYDFSITGCKQCDCSSIGGSNLCDADTGECRCKENVEGEKCMTCKDNAFSLQVRTVDLGLPE